MRKSKNPSVVRTPNFPLFSEEHYYSYLFLLIPHRSETELIQPYLTAKDAFIQKRDIMDSEMDFTFFSFTQHIENTMRRINLANMASEETYVQPNATVNSTCDVFNDMDFETVYMTMCPQENNKDDKRTDSSKNFTFDDDFHMHSLHCSVSIDEFKRSIESMTTSQTKALHFVKSKFETRNCPFHLFITGGAGVGKTYITKVLISYIQLYCAEVPNSNPVIVCAPTGTASNNINGRTLHSVFKIPVASFLQYGSLSSYSISKLRQEFKNVHTIVIDEISMVSSEMFSFKSRRLSEIKNNNNVFGGCNIIVIGDFFQLRPVKGSFCFKNMLIWQLFDSIFLTENVRQKNDHVYSALLNRVRIGYPSDEDILLLKTRLVYNTQVNFSEHLHIFPTRKQVELFNKEQLTKLCNKTYVIHAEHYFSSSERNAHALVPMEMIPVDNSLAGGLEKELMISINCRVMLTRNINTDQGLVNGAMGVVTNIDCIGSIPSIIHVKFDNPTIGQVICNGRNTVHTPVHIQRIETEFIYKGHHIVRSQFPLILSWACTVHKVQGISLDSAVVDLGSTVFDYGMAYVALSRVRTLSGLILIRLDPMKIKASDSVINEYERLKNLLL